MSRLRLPALAFLLLAAFARAQPEMDGPPPDFGAFASEIQTRPTTAKTVHPRMKRLMMSLRARGIPPAPEQRSELKKLHGLLTEGSLTKAARVMDSLVVSLAKQPSQREFPPAPIAAAAAPAAVAAAAPAPRVDETFTGTPQLLATPLPVAKAALPAAPAAALNPIAPASSARVDQSQFVRAQQNAQAPAPSGLPWPILSALGGLLALGGAGAVLLIDRKTRKTSRFIATAVAGPADEAPPPASLTDKYTLGRLIASGGMGEVYEGKDSRLGRRVAIKRMLSDIKLDAGLRAQFLNEAKTVAKLSHPYIVPIHECLESGGDLYLVFEYVEGESLSQRLSRDARLPLKECRRILTYIAQALEYAHGRHVLHRDIKPANIMLGADEIARVMDFGIALESTRTMTSTGPGILDASGTLRYMPPEQHYGKSVRASDVYAMGVCLYEMATGHPPFAAASVDELIAQKRAAKYPPPSTLLSSLPKELDLLIAAALAPDAGRRVSTAREFLDLLESLPA